MVITSLPLTLSRVWLASLIGAISDSSIPSCSFSSWCFLSLLPAYFRPSSAQITTAGDGRTPNLLTPPNRKFGRVRSNSDRVIFTPSILTLSGQIGIEVMKKGESEFITQNSPKSNLNFELGRP